MDSPKEEAATAGGEGRGGGQRRVSKRGQADAASGTDLAKKATAMEVPPMGEPRTVKTITSGEGARGRKGGWESRVRPGKLLYGEPGGAGPNENNYHSKAKGGPRGVVCLVSHPALVLLCSGRRFRHSLTRLSDEIRCIYDNRRAICMRQPPMQCSLLYITGASRPHLAARRISPRDNVRSCRCRGIDTWEWIHVVPRFLTPAELRSPSLAVALGACSPE